MIRESCVFRQAFVIEMSLFLQGTDKVLSSRCNGVMALVRQQYEQTRTGLLRDSLSERHQDFRVPDCGQ